MKKRIRSWLVAALVPAFLVLLGLRLMLLPAFLQLEYLMPGFPADPYGFSPDDRLRWAGYASSYLTNGEGIGYLESLRFGDGVAVFNSRELSHMEDVKWLVGKATAIFYGALAVLVLLGVWAFKSGRLPEFRSGLSLGGWLTVGLAVIAGILSTVGFQTFFVSFHEALFPAGSWDFPVSDTLIRLFPERFWADVLAYDLGLALAGGAALGVIMKPGKNQE